MAIYCIESRPVCCSLSKGLGSKPCFYKYIIDPICNIAAILKELFLILFSKNKRGKTKHIY